MKKEIIISNQEHYDAAIEFSNANIKKDPSQRNTLPECIEYLANGAIDGTKLHLTPDFVGHSFSFALTREVDGKEKLVMHGGIILHGYEQTFSVELSPPSGPHYSIHTQKGNITKLKSDNDKNYLPKKYPVISPFRGDHF